MHRFLTRSLPLLGLFALATACAPSYELGLKPARSTSLFVEGREQARAQADSMEVRMSFVCYEASRVVFEVEYRNPTSQTLIIDPAAFRYEASRVAHPDYNLQGRRRPKPLPGVEVSAAVAAASQALMLPPLPLAPVNAFDPEPEITALHDRAESEANKAARIDWLGITLSLATVVADVASIPKTETAAQYQRRAAIHDAANTYNIISAANKIEHAIAANVLQRRATQLQEYALRKVTLQPGQQVRGYLYFPRYDAADALVVQAPVGTRMVPLEFAQVRRRQ